MKHLIVVLAILIAFLATSVQASSSEKWVQGCYVWGPVRSMTTNLTWCSFWNAPLHWFWKN